MAQLAIRLPLAFIALVLLEGVSAVAETQKHWIDRDRVYCGHLDCTKLSTFAGEKFCSPCDTQHYCECVQTCESLPYLRKCADASACQATDRRGSCKQTMEAELCSHIEEAYRYL